MTLHASFPELLASDGEMAALIRAHDWSATPAGPAACWSRSLRATLGIVLTSRHPMFLWWGPELVQFYNDGYRPSLGADRHPAALGASGRTFWAEIWPTIGPQIEAVMKHGQATWHDDQLVPIFRNGRLEEVYWTYGYSPVRDDDGTVGGTLVVVQEQTSRVVGERRLRLLRDLAALAGSDLHEPDVWAEVTATLAANPYDVPWSAWYVSDGAGRAARLGRTSAPSLPSRQIAAGDTLRRVVDRAIETGEAVTMSDVSDHVGDIIGSAWPEPVRHLFVAPIRLGERGRPHAVLVVGASPRLPWDSAYRDFLQLAADQIALLLARARQRDHEQRRADALAELDRAKTDFFNSISHEFRTPLTLMLTPTEEALRSPGQALSGTTLQMVHRNQLRLLKLVTTLLEFSRLEARRAVAMFEPLDLAQVTSDVCTSFRSTIELANLQFIVDCPPLPEPVYVDRDMWERIVLNLISNAFKFTLSGAIDVSLRVDGEQIRLAVRDTGSGIPQHHLSQIFERFHRVESTPARTHDGSGIGLAVVRELVQLHGGSCHVTSEVGQGATFTVSLRRGRDHLDPEHLRPQIPARPSGAAAFVHEARGWIEAGRHRAVPDATPITDRTARILVVDDNRDMREYLRDLLAERWQVNLAANGNDALAAIRGGEPDLVIADVMMPALDGFGLLRALRDNHRTAAIPVMLLTARAGPEAQADGWSSGADDYLVKPFAARELLARVDGLLRRKWQRDIETAVDRRLHDMLAHAPVGIAILRGPEHIYEFVNAAYANLYGGRSLVGLPFHDAAPWETHILELLDHVCASGEVDVARALPISVDNPAGHAAEPVFFDAICQPLFDAGRRVDGVCLVLFDVSELARARQAAVQAQQMTELALETGRLGSWRIDLRTRHRWNSTRCLANFGLPPDASLTYDDVIRAQHPQDRDCVAALMAEAIATGADYQAEYRVVWPDGSCHWLSVRGRTMYADNGTPLYMAGNTLDVTDQRQLVDELRDTKAALEDRVRARTQALANSNAQLTRALRERDALETARREWLRTLMTAQEDERGRVARELHDELSQHLVALTIGLDGVKQTDEKSISRLQTIVANIDRSVHRLARDLRPAALDDLGLQPALTAYVDEWSQQTHITGDVTSRGHEHRLPPHIESALYRIVQEALTNVARHSRARHASVVIEHRGDAVIVVIEDDGIGFDADDLEGGARFGLIGMRERATLLGGSLAVESTPHGTSLFVTIPLDPARGGRTTPDG